MRQNKTYWVLAFASRVEITEEGIINLDISVKTSLEIENVNERTVSGTHGAATARLDLCCRSPEERRGLRGLEKPVEEMVTEN